MLGGWWSKIEVIQVLGIYNDASFKDFDMHGLLPSQSSTDSPTTASLRHHGELHLSPISPVTDSQSLRWSTPEAVLGSSPPGPPLPHGSRAPAPPPGPLAPQEPRGRRCGASPRAMPDGSHSCGTGRPKWAGPLGLWRGTNPFARVTRTALAAWSLSGWKLSSWALT